METEHEAAQRLVQAFQNIDRLETGTASSIPDDHPTLFTRQVELFFQDPATSPASSGSFGVLFLLRRDVNHCIGSDPNSGKALFLAAIGVMTAIDLLAKFSKGDKGKSGPRFRCFVRMYFESISSEEADTIYQLRNALVHSFGLYSKSKCRIYHFSLGQARGLLVQELGNDRYRVDIRTLHDRFETAIEKYRNDLMGDETLQKRFQEMYSKYGTIHIG